MNVFSKFVSLTVLALSVGTAIVPQAQAHTWQNHLAGAAGQGSVNGISNIHVDSRVGSTIAVYINGVYRGTMGPSGDLYLYVGDASYQTTYLRAVSADGRVWTNAINGSFANFQWVLY